MSGKELKKRRKWRRQVSTDQSTSSGHRPQLASSQAHRALSQQPAKAPGHRPWLKCTKQRPRGLLTAAGCSLQHSIAGHGRAVIDTDDGVGVFDAKHLAAAVQYLCQERLCLQHLPVRPQEQCQVAFGEVRTRSQMPPSCNQAAHAGESVGVGGPQDCFSGLQTQLV